MADTVEPTPGPNAAESKRAVLEAIKGAQSPPVLTTGMIAKRVDYSRRTVHNKVQELKENGQIKSGEVGSATAYWIPDDHPSGSLPPAVDQDQTPDGGYVTTWRDRILVTALAVLVGIGLVGAFGVIASLAGSTLPLPLSVWASAWGVGLLAAIAVTFALVWSVYDIAKLEKIRREKYADTHWLRSWLKL